MSRYQIGVGNEFPLDEDQPDAAPLYRGCCGGWARAAGHRWDAPWAGPGGGRWVGRFGGGPGPVILRGVFLLSLGVVAVTHALAVVLILGIFLLARHSPWMREARARWRARWQDRMDHGAFV